MPTIDYNIERGRHVYGAFREIHGQYTGPASYVTGGDAIAPGDVGLGDIEDLSFDLAVNATPVCLLVGYNHTTGKAVWFDLAGNQVANAQDLSGYTTRFRARGK